MKDISEIEFNNVIDRVQNEQQSSQNPHWSNIYERDQLMNNMLTLPIFQKVNPNSINDCQKHWKKK